MKTPSQHLLATGKTSTVDTANGCSVHCMGLKLFRVDAYSREFARTRGGMRRYKLERIKVWALSEEDAKDQVKASRPDLSMDWPKVRRFNPVTSDDLGGVRWEEFNQAERECLCLAVIPRVWFSTPEDGDGGAGLFAYQMPAGKVFMFTVDAFGENKSVSLRGLSRAWIRALWEAGAGNGPVPERAQWFTPEGKAALRELILSNFDGGKLGLW